MTQNLFSDTLGPSLPANLKAIIGVDPSKNNTGVARVDFDLPTFQVKTIRCLRIRELLPGGYTEAMNQLVARECSLGFVEITKGTGKAGTNTLAVIGETRGMALEAIGALGVPAFLMEVHSWRHRALGDAPLARTRTGKKMSYWTKGDKSYDIPDNVTPACLKAIRELGPQVAIDKIGYTSVTPEMLSTGELEAICIALAGLDMWKNDELELA